MNKLIVLFIIFILCIAASAASAQVTSDNIATQKTIVVETNQVSLNGLDLNPSKVEVKRTAGSRIIVETTVSTNGKKRATEIVATVLTPQVEVVEGIMQLNVKKQVFVNNSEGSVYYRIYLPANVELIN